MGDAGPPSPPSQLGTPQDQIKDIHVLVTGFGPFKSFTTNPSWLIAQSLPTQLESLPPKALTQISNPTAEIPPAPAQATLHRHLAALLGARQQPTWNTPPQQPLRPPNTSPYRIQIHTYPEPVRVAYASTSVLIPSLLDPRTNGGVNYDYILHIGLASGRDSYTLETQAHRDDYLIPDVDEQSGYHAGEKIWKRLEVPVRLEAGWDSGDVLTRWVGEVERKWEGFVERYMQIQQTKQKLQDENEERKDGGTGFVNRHGIFGLRAATQDLAGENVIKPPRKPVVKLSKDAGRFLCESIFMCSLVVRWRAVQAHRLALAGLGTTDSVKLGSDGVYTNHERTDDPREKIGKVAFLHVPNGTDETSIAVGALIAESAVRALVASWEDGYRNPTVYGQDVMNQVAGVTQAVKVEGGVFETQGTGDQEGASMQYH